MTDVPTAMDVPRAPRRARSRMLRPALAVGGAAVLCVVTVALARLRGAAPIVERDAVLVDTVRRGPMLREVQGPGRLVPEEIRWITARTSARVERVLAQPGAKLTPDTILLVLSNTELELSALEAERQVASAQAELAVRDAQLQRDRLAQESTVATLRSEAGDARRRAAADRELAKKGFLSELEMAQSSDRASELGGRVEFERQRLAALGHGNAAQLAAQRAEVERLRAIAAFRRRDVEALTVRAGVPGVLQELPLQAGQSVAPGATLAKVVQPDRLKAEIRVPETLAKDVAIGQPATIDTRNGVAAGRVSRVDPAAQGGTVAVEVSFPGGTLPAGARPDLSVEGTVEIERIADAVTVGRPAFAQPQATVGLWKLVDGGEAAVRVNVRLGRGSARSVEVVSGLAPGDQVIVSDMSRWDAVERVRLR